MNISLYAFGKPNIKMKSNKHRLFVLLTILSCMAFIAYASPNEIDNEPNDQKIYPSAEQQPTFPGGDAALMRYLRSHINYPPEAGENDIQGKVVVQFVVEKNGDVGEVKVVRSSNKELDQEAIRVTKSLPPFNPGLQDGQPVRVWYTIPIVFNPEHSENNKIENPLEGQKIYASVEQPPTFPGGVDALIQYLRSHINYPFMARECGIQGIVVVQFFVEENGNVGEVKVIHSVDKDLDREAIRLAKSLPAFSPALQDGRPVRAWYTLPISFSLQNSSENK